MNSRSLPIVLWLVSTQAALGQDADAMHEGSLFRQDQSYSLLSTRTATRVGDIVTILIAESSSSSFNASTSATKKDSTVVDPIRLPIVDFFKSTLFGAALGGGSVGASSSLSGTGQTNNAQRFVARIAVVVKEVLPNGNLRLEGERWLRVNNETQKVRLVGVVRRDDVRPDNTVLSEDVANARIESDGKGVISQRQRKGILTAILDWLF